MSGAPRRVRLRLAAWSTVVFAAVLVAVGVAVVAAFARALDAQAMRQADASAQRVERLLVDELGGDVDAAELAEELREEADVAWYAVQVPGWPRIESAEWQRADVAALRAEMEAVVASRATRRTTVDVESVGPLRVVANSVAVGGADIAFAIGFEERPLRDSMTSFLAILAIVGPLALIVAFAGGYWLAGRLLAPVRVLADAAEDITIERIRTRLPVRGESDEFDRVAVAFNAVLDRLEAAFDGLRRFTSDASHELRTPLAAIRAVAEVALRADGAGERERMRDAISSMLEEIERLTTLIDRLLTLTRADAPGASRRAEPFDLARIARDAVATLEPIAEERGLALSCAADDAVLAVGDADAVRGAALNLVDNALRYTPRGGRITVRCAIRGAQATLEVADTGLGIAAEHHARVFERFFRADPSRTNANGGGGVGLGLAIAKAGVEACGGRIELVSALARGASFTIVLPRATSAESSARAT